MEQFITEQIKYIEPIGFKGTRGKWNLLRNDNGEYYFRKQFIQGESVANQSIMNQSKELAKALQEMLTWKHCYELRNDDEKETFDACIENAKQVLKDAGLE